MKKLEWKESGNTITATEKEETEPIFIVKENEPTRKINCFLYILDKKYEDDGIDVIACNNVKDARVLATQLYNRVIGG